MTPAVAAWFLVFTLHGQPYALGPFLYEATCRASIENARTLDRAGVGGSLDWGLPQSATCEARDGPPSIPPARNSEWPQASAAP